MLRRGMKKLNVYNYHLATCTQRPEMIDDDREIIVKIKEVMESVAKKKKEEEIAKKSFW